MHIWNYVNDIIYSIESRSYVRNPKIGIPFEVVIGQDWESHKTSSELSVMSDIISERELIERLEIAKTFVNKSYSNQAYNSAFVQFSIITFLHIWFGISRISFLMWVLKFPIVLELSA